MLRSNPADSLSESQKYDWMEPLKPSSSQMSLAHIQGNNQAAKSPDLAVRSSASPIIQHVIHSTQGLETDEDSFENGSLKISSQPGESSAFVSDQDRTITETEVEIIQAIRDDQLSLISTTVDSDFGSVSPEGNRHLTEVEIMNELFESTKDYDDIVFADETNSITSAEAWKELGFIPSTKPLESTTNSPNRFLPLGSLSSSEDVKKRLSDARYSFTSGILKEDNPPLPSKIPPPPPLAGPVGSHATSAASSRTPDLVTSLKSHPLHSRATEEVQLGLLHAGETAVDVLMRIVPNSFVSL